MVPATRRVHAGVVMRGVTLRPSSAWLARTVGGDLDLVVALLPDWIPLQDRSGSWICSPSKRHPGIVVVRQVVAWLLHRALGVSSPVTGEILGGRDHGTILRACERVEREIVAGKGPRLHVLLGWIGNAARGDHGAR